MDSAVESGVDFFSGVPCSYLANVFSEITSRELRYWPATREDSSCAIATGAFLAGARPLVAMQNSGFGNSINALCSLVIPYRIPLILLVSWRGEPELDSPEHDVMGRAFPSLIEALGLRWAAIRDEGPAESVKSAVNLARKENLPFVLIARKGDL